LDLLLFRGGRRLGFEIKYTDAPKATRSARTAIGQLGLESLTIVCPEDAAYPLDDTIRVRGLERLARGREDLFV
jgi:hypothetical protein